MLQAYKNKQSLKQETVYRMKKHIELDQLVQGIGYDESSGEGCGVGCSINCYDHQTFADALEVDLWIPQIYDNLHEGISAKHIAEFNINFLNSIQVGMSKEQSDTVRLKLFYFVLTQIIPSKFQKYEKIAAIIDLFKQSIEGVTVTKKQWSKVTNDIPSEYRFPASAYASASTSASASTFVYTSASAFASAYASASAFASAYTSAYAYALASISTPAYALVYASTPAYASAYASASKYAFASKQEAMLKISNKLIKLFREV